MGRCFLTLKQRKGYAGGVLEQVSQKRWAWGNCPEMVSFFRGEAGAGLGCGGGRENLGVPALRELEHSSAVSSFPSSLQAWKRCLVWGNLLGMLSVSSRLPRVITMAPVLRVANGAIIWKTHGGQYLFIVLELVSGKEEWLDAYGKFQGFPTDAKPSRLSPVPFRLHMQMQIYMWVHSYLHPCAHAFVFRGSFTPGWSQRMVQFTGNWDAVLGLMWEHCHTQRVHFNAFVQKYVTPSPLLSWPGVELTSKESS